jgi:subfamily B ATP-binding cassette protein MsbA
MSKKSSPFKNQRISGEQEWFDKEYTAKEVYSRLWSFARRYKTLIFTGAILGMITGGAWAPIFSFIKPMIDGMQDATTQVEVVAAPAEKPPIATIESPTTPSGTQATTPTKKLSKLERQSQKDAEKYQKYLDLIGSYLAKFGITGPVATLIVFALFAACAICLKMVTQYFNQYYLTKAGMKVVMDVRNAMFKHLQEQSLAFHGRTDVGRLMSRATGDPETIRTLISQTMSDLCRAPFEILTAVLFICFFAIQNDMVSLLLIATVGFPTCMLPIVWIGKQIRRWSKRLLEQSAGIGSNFHENLTCIKIVKAYNTEAAEVSKYEDYNLKAFKICMRATRWSILVGPLTETVAFLLAAIFVAYCLSTGHGLSEIIPLIPPFLILYKPMKQLGRLQVALENGRAALQRIFSLLDVHQELEEKADALPLTEFKDALTFDNVSFGYDTKKENIITNANFTIRPGQMFAVVGSTGSGKSTLANLLARFYDVTAGKITIDGHDLRDYRISDVRKTVGAVTQEALLFNTTVAANIAYGTPNATQEEIEAAAKLANAHDFIMAHPEGYQRIVGEKGFVLSGGERQRVAIARAILKNPPILILDEATSALDTVTEQQVQSAINNLMKNRTTFAIAHRLSTIRQADCILVLDHGNIVERGTHEELYAKGGVYRKLCDIQNQQA